MEKLMNKKTLVSLAVVAIVFLLGIIFWKVSQGENTSSLDSEKNQLQLEETEAEIEPMNQTNQENQLPEMEIDQTKRYEAVMETTAGTITIRLNAQETPITVNNFVSLAKENFYDETIFHRVIKGFMIQGGDPKGDGTGGPGYRFDDEPFQGEYTRGTLAMANAGPNTNGSQFFIMHQDYNLPKNYVIFGKLIDGFDVLDKIATAPVQASPMGENSQPVSPIKIISLKIVES